MCWKAPHGSKEEKEEGGRGGELTKRGVREVFGEREELELIKRAIREVNGEPEAHMTTRATREVTGEEELELIKRAVREVFGEPELTKRAMREVIGELEARMTKQIVQEVHKAFDAQRNACERTLPWEQRQATMTPRAGGEQPDTRSSPFNTGVRTGQPQFMATADGLGLGLGLGWSRRPLLPLSLAPLLSSATAAPTLASTTTTTAVRNNHHCVEEREQEQEEKEMEEEEAEAEEENAKQKEVSQQDEGNKRKRRSTRIKLASRFGPPSKVPRQNPTPVDDDDNNNDDGDDLGEVVCRQLTLVAEDIRCKKHKLYIVCYAFNNDYYYRSRHLYILGALRGVNDSCVRAYLRNKVDNDIDGMMTVKGASLAKIYKADAAVVAKVDKGVSPRGINFYNVKYMRKVMSHNVPSGAERSWWNDILDQMEEQQKGFQ